MQAGNGRPRCRSRAAITAPAHLKVRCTKYGTQDNGGSSAEENLADLLPHADRQRAGTGMLRELPEEERQAIGKDLLRAQWRWPVGMPLCRAMGRASGKF